MNEFGIYSSKFQAYVAWVDHNGTVGDLQKEGTIENISPQTGRGIHLGVFRLGHNGTGIALNVVVPQEVVGSFKVPQVGDLIWIEETRRDYGRSPVYLYSSYNGTVDQANVISSSPVPQWGSFPGDYGHLRTHRDHNKQFFPKTNSNFVKKYIRSVTGYRFRSFYRGNLKKGRFAVRGDSVFDIDGSISEKYLVEDGSYIAYGGDLESDQGAYPNPLNVPSEMKENDDYSYRSVVFEPIDVRPTADHYDFGDKSSEKKFQTENFKLKNLDFMAYQPIMDKSYLEKADFERELPAAEEYQVALRGNNKLLIQDQYGDGEQLLITLKNQYDAGFTIVHNADKGQVRIRDHMGQGVLLEANPEAPRVISWTANRQVIEQGSVKDVGEFTYIRNGGSFGDSETSFGTKTGVTKDDVSNQEFLMVSTPDIISELGSRLSGGMLTLATRGYSAGIYIRNNVDPELSSQEYAMYQDGSSMTVEFLQENEGVDGSTQNTLLRQSMDGSVVTQISELRHTSPATQHSYTETVSVSNSSATKTQEMSRLGSDTITFIESISGDNTAQSERTVTWIGGEYSTSLMSGATITNSSFTSSGLQSDTIISPSSIVTTKYNNNVAQHSITQSNSEINIARLVPGININIGADSQDGQITIGNIESNVTIEGGVLNIEGTTMTIDGNKTINGPTNFTNVP